MYTIGLKEKRPWGYYVITGIEEDEKKTITTMCEKVISIEPKQILSLQKHFHRSERWVVLYGTLTFLVDGKVGELHAGQDGIFIPPNIWHSMANLSFKDRCAVFEHQEGSCQEDDILRLADAYHRADGKVDGTKEDPKHLIEYTKLLESVK